MNLQNLKNRTNRTSALKVIAILVAGLLIIAAVSWRAAAVTHAQDDGSAPPALPRTITVVGEGQISIEPDIARATIGVEVINSSAQEASAENKQVLAAVLAALEENGVAPDDIQTNNFSIWAERFNPEPTSASEVRYHVTNNMLITVRDLDSLGEVLDAAIAAGANNIYDVQFALDDPDGMKSTVRQAAIDDARAKAEELATLAGVSVGEVVSISEVVGGSVPYASFAQPNLGMGGGGGVPVSPGQLKLSMQLQVIYAIGE